MRRNVMRQALAGMLWSKQFYYYDVDRWLEEHGSDPFKHSIATPSRNERWHHMYNANVISMPDKWEYPWYAAWDLAFHVIPLNMVDPDFSKQQLDLMLSERYLHPSGQLPAYEWNFGDVNPPVHAWSTIFTYRLDALKRGQGDLDWLERIFHKLLLNFTWWVNRKDRQRQQRVRRRLSRPRQHRRVRSQCAAADRRLSRAGGRHGVDGALLPEHDRNRRRARAAPAGLRRHVPQVHRALPVDRAGALACRRTPGMWDEEDGFFYDVLRLPDGRSERLKVRSMVGLLPFCAVTVFEGRFLKRHPELIAADDDVSRVAIRS